MILRYDLSMMYLICRAKKPYALFVCSDSSWNVASLGRIDGGKVKDWIDDFRAKANFQTQLIGRKP